MLPIHRLLPLAYLLLASAGLHARATHEGVQGELRDAARAFVTSLTPAQQEQSCYALADEKRLSWNFIPMRRQGIALGQLNLKQRRAAHDLLAELLSAEGYLKVQAIMSLESILRELESTPDRPALHRDAEDYHFLFFGDVTAGGPLGMQIEGHHLSLNLLISDTIESLAPVFLGASPHEVRSGPKAGLRVLREEEDHGRRLLNSLSAEQLKTALIADFPPRDVILGPGRDIGTLDMQGLPGSEMSVEQRAMLLELIAVYTNLFEERAAHEHLRRASACKPEELSFAWAGSREIGQPHYFRLHAGDQIIEYDNVQGGANHSHTVWRDARDEFGVDYLRRHLDEVEHRR